MKSPKTYRGYNDKNECIAEFTGADANEYINPAEVKAAIDNIKTVMEEQLGTISGALRDEVDDAEHALIVQGTHMGDPINDTAKTIDKIPDAVYSSLQEVYKQAEISHDKIQDAANDDARDQAKNTAGVVRVA